MRPFLVVLLACLALTCGRAETFYTTDAAYTPGPEPDTYLMKVIIKKITVNRGTEKEEIVVAPGVTSKFGQPARIELLGGKKSIGVTISTFYPRTDDNNGAITCSVELKEKGKVTYRTKVSVNLDVRS
ncbi:MAG TPA: hypothetical protein VF773_19065 [Verrucomicrobiae bacterium]